MTRLQRKGSELTDEGECWVLIVCSLWSVVTVFSASILILGNFQIGFMTLLSAFKADLE